MFSRATQYSYKEQKYQRYKLLKIISIFLILFILYNCITAFLFSVWVIDNDTMQPNLAQNDMVIFTSIKSLKSPFSNSKNADESYLFKRGSIVLVDMSRKEDKNLALRALDTVVRFFTAQKISVFAGSNRYFVKRVIALPGDEISMTDYVFKVKTSTGLYSLTEFELSDKPYHPGIPKTPSLWDESLPFSGTMDPVILGSNECFVISDDRSNTNDSRTWGAIPPSMITARAVLRFWPFNKIQLL